MSTLTEQVSRFVVETSIDDMTEDLRAIAIPPIIDTVGVIAAGLSGPAGATINRYAEAVSVGSRERPSWTGVSAVLPPEVEAMVMSTLGHGLDFDDEMSGVGHPSSLILSAILALPRREPLTGRALVEAFVVGYEVNVKVAKAISNRHYRKGWHTTCTVGGFGSAAAVCKLLGLDVEQTATALGIVGTLASGLQRNFGTMTKPLHSGLAARNGVLAGQLAFTGFTAAQDVLDGPRGFLDVYSEGDSRPEFIGNLADPWAMIDHGPTLKRYPCCYSTHRPIDVTRQLQEKLDLTEAELDKIVVRAPTFALTPLIYPWPETGLQGKFSPTYTVASAFVDRDVTLGTFTDDMVRREEVRRVMAKIDVAEDPRCRPEDPTAARSSAGTGGFWEVTIHAKDGRVEQGIAHHPTGSPEKPLSWSEIESKFLGCLAVVGRDQEAGQAVFERLKAIEDVADVHALLDELSPAS